MIKKRKTASTKFPCDITIDENGKGSFNALSVEAYLYQTIKSVFAPSHEQIIELLDRKIDAWEEAWDNEPKKELAYTKKPSLNDAAKELSKDREADIEMCYEHASRRLKEEISPFLDDALRELANEIARDTIDVLSPNITSKVDGGIKTRLKKIIRENQKRNRWNLGFINASRPKGSGLFRSNDDFLTALKDVLANSKIRHSQPNVLRELTRHRLYHGNPLTLQTCKNNTKTLRNWLDRCGLTWEEALKKYSKSRI